MQAILMFSFFYPPCSSFFALWRNSLGLKIWTDNRPCWYFLPKHLVEKEACYHQRWACSAHSLGSILDCVCLQESESFHSRNLHRKRSFLLTQYTSWHHLRWLHLQWGNTCMKVFAIIDRAAPIMHQHSCFSLPESPHFLTLFIYFWWGTLDVSWGRTVVVLTRGCASQWLQVTLT